MKTRPVIWIAITCAGLALALIWIRVVTATAAASETSTLSRTYFPEVVTAGECVPWVPVNDPAFGLGTGADSDYSAEEGFEVLVAGGRLYVGMEADNSLGARLWRTRSGVAVPQDQSDWEEVAADANGLPFGVANTAQADHIDSLAEFGGDIYASLANRSGIISGTLVFRSPTGASGSWTPVISPGFGSVDNGNFKDMLVFNIGGVDWLCGGTANDKDGAQVWCTQDGNQWEQKNTSGFGNPDNVLITSMEVFQGALYAGITNQQDGSLWRSTDLVGWTPVYTATDRPSVSLAGGFNGQLYIAEGALDGRLPADPTIRVLRSPSGDPATWNEVAANIGADLHNTRTIVDGAAVYNTGLYLSVMNNDTGVEIWRTTDGVDWQQVASDGFGHSSTFAAELIPFNGYLYAWSSDYSLGQRVYRSNCPLVEIQDITSNGLYDYSSVGVQLDFSSEGLDQVEIRLSPGAFPTAQTVDLPVKRFYKLLASPVGAAFMADLTLSYSQEEFDASDIADESTTFLTRWDGSVWSDCPMDRRSRDPLLNTVTCQGVSGFSVWAIAGLSAAGAPVKPVVVKIQRFEVKQEQLDASLLAILPVAILLLSALIRKFDGQS
jgi:hypothetical protein